MGVVLHPFEANLKRRKPDFIIPGKERHKDKNIGCPCSLT
jgi:hypothetical protein